MANFIKLTEKEGEAERELWISKFQILYLEDDARHNQTIIRLANNEELKVKENIQEILSKFEK